jgi:hypothetical protein
VIASLNHPNFCTLFDVGPNYLVVESIDGPTLTDRDPERSARPQKKLTCVSTLSADRRTRGM